MGAAWGGGGAGACSGTRGRAPAWRGSAPVIAGAVVGCISQGGMGGPDVFIRCSYAAASRAPPAAVAAPTTWFCDC